MQDVALVAGTSGDTAELRESIRNRTTISSEESSFAMAVLKSLDKIILTVTYHLQYQLDEDERKKVLNSQLEAMISRSGTLTATEATAQALLQERPIQQDTMQKLITDIAAKAVKKAFQQQKLQKNSPGGQKSPTASPQNRSKKNTKNANHATATTGINKKAVSNLRKRAQDTPSVTFASDVKQPQKKRRKKSQGKDHPGGKKNEQKDKGRRKQKQQKQGGSTK